MNKSSIRSTMEEESKEKLDQDFEMDNQDSLSKNLQDNQISSKNLDPSNNNDIKGHTSSNVSADGIIVKDSEGNIEKTLTEDQDTNLVDSDKFEANEMQNTEVDNGQTDGEVLASEISSRETVEQKGATGGSKEISECGPEGKDHSERHGKDPKPTGEIGMDGSKPDCFINSNPLENVALKPDSGNTTGLINTDEITGENSVDITPHRSHVTSEIEKQSESGSSSVTLDINNQKRDSDLAKISDTQENIGAKDNMGLNSEEKETQQKSSVQVNQTDCDKGSMHIGVDSTASSNESMASGENKANISKEIIKETVCVSDSSENPSSDIKTSNMCDTENEKGAIEKGNLDNNIKTTHQDEQASVSDMSTNIDKGQKETRTDSETLVSAQIKPFAEATSTLLTPDVEKTKLETPEQGTPGQQPESELASNIPDTVIIQSTGSDQNVNQMGSGSEKVTGLYDVSDTVQISESGSTNSPEKNENTTQSTKTEAEKQTSSVTDEDKSNQEGNLQLSTSASCGDEADPYSLALDDALCSVSVNVHNLPSNKSIDFQGNDLNENQDATSASSIIGEVPEQSKNELPNNDSHHRNDNQSEAELLEIKNTALDNIPEGHKHNINNSAEIEMIKDDESEEVNTVLCNDFNLDNEDKEKKSGQENLENFNIGTSSRSNSEHEMGESLEASLQPCKVPGEIKRIIDKDSDNLNQAALVATVDDQSCLESAPVHESVSVDITKTKEALEAATVIDRAEVSSHQTELEQDQDQSSPVSENVKHGHNQKPLEAKISKTNESAKEQDPVNTTSKPSQELAVGAQNEGASLQKASDNITAPAIKITSPEERESVSDTSEDEVFTPGNGVSKSDPKDSLSTDVVESNVTPDQTSAKGEAASSQVENTAEPDGSKLITPESVSSMMGPPGSNVVLRKKAGVRVYVKPENKDVALQQKIDHEIKMRDGTAKLLAASKHTSQLVEAAKNLLASNARMIAYMSELQRRKTNEILNISGSQSPNSRPCSAKVAVSDMRVPLMWKETDHFKNRGDNRKFAVFCLWRIGTQIFDTTLLKDVDRSMTDLTFDDVVIFEDISPDFECHLEIYCHKINDDSISTPRRIRKKFNDISTSVGRSVGRRLSGMKDDPEFMSNMIVGPRFEMIASAKMTLSDISDGIGIFDLSTNTSASTEGGNLELPLFGNFCCRLAAQPLCMVVEAAAGHLNVKPGPDPWRNMWCILGKQSLIGWASEREQKQDKSPIMDLTITPDSRVKQIEVKDEQGCVIQLSAWSNGRRRHYQYGCENDKDRDIWRNALQQHIVDIAAWKQACDKLMTIEQTTPPNRRSFYERQPRASLYDDTPWDDGDSPMTRILSRLELEENATGPKPPV